MSMFGQRTKTTVLMQASAVAVGAMLVLGAAWVHREALGGSAYLIYFGAVLALTAIVSLVFSLLFDRLDDRAAEQSVATTPEEQLGSLRQELEDAANRLNQREQALAEKLVAFQEWMEFPQALETLEADSAAGENAIENEASATDAELQELARKDRVVMTLLDEEAKQLFENIRENKFTVEGKFQPLVLRDQAFDLMIRVARVYQPDAKNPLLETSLEQVLRSGGRICLHLLVVMEQLPLKTQQYNMATLYSYVQRAIAAYVLYQGAQPFLPYLSSAFYLGRFAMGANPVSLAAWRLANELGMRGAKSLATQVMNKHVLALASDIVRVIGFEVANVYGGEFRYRDANWIFAAEVVELAHVFSPDSHSLQRALTEIGSLQLRSEYDRIYLYRCAAAGRSPQPQRYRAQAVLSAEERAAIARRLERFAASFAKDAAAKEAPSRELLRWRQQVEKRLQVKLNIATPPATENQAEQMLEAGRALASFLLAAKEREPEEIEALLAPTAVFQTFSPDQRQSLLDDLQENPPFFLEQPDLAIGGQTAKLFLQDLAWLAVNTPPHAGPWQSFLDDAAACLGETTSHARTLLDKQYTAWIRTCFPADAPTGKRNAKIGRVLAPLADVSDAFRFLYHGVSLEAGANNLPASGYALVGCDEELVLVHLEDSGNIVWAADAGSVHLEEVRGYLRNDCRLGGGHFLSPDDSDTLSAAPTSNPTTPVLRISGAVSQSYAKYFAPLLPGPNTKAAEPSDDA